MGEHGIGMTFEAKFGLTQSLFPDVTGCNKIIMAGSANWGYFHGFWGGGVKFELELKI